MTERIEIGSGGGIITHEGDGSGLTICHDLAGRVAGAERIVSLEAAVICGTCLRLMAARSTEQIMGRKDVARWEQEAAASASMTLWKSRYLVAMKWLHEAEKEKA